MPDNTIIDDVKSNLTKTLGDSGTTRYGGYFQEEENTKWRDETRTETVDEMRKTDGAVQAALKALKAPILSTEWRVDTYGDDPLSIEIKEFVETNIFHLKRSWKQFVREALGFLEFGHYTFELIYELKDGKIHLSDIAPRIPSSIQNWQGVVNGQKSRGITQLIRTDEAEGKTSTVFIPEEKLLILTNEKEGDDVTGQSVLRAAYIHFKYKNVLYRVSGVSADRYGVGIPTVFLPENFSEADKASAEEGAQNVRSSEKSYMVLPHGFDFKIITPDGNPVGSSIDSLIAHHNRMILVTTLTQFLDLGSDGGGSYALSGDQSSFFLRCVEEKADYFAEEFTNQVIKRLVILNYGEQEWYPELKHTTVGNKDLKALADMLNILTMSGALEVDTDIKKWVRQMFKLPELTDDQVEESEAKEDKTGSIEQPEDDEDDEDDTALSEKKKTFLAERSLKISRTLTMQEDRMNLKLLNDAFNETETDLEDELSQATNEEINRYAEAVKAKLDAGDIAGIAGLSYMLTTKSKKAIEAAVKKAYEDGKTGAAKEVGIDRPSTPTVDTQVMNMDINDWARGYVYELEQKSREIIKDAVMSGASAAAIATAVKSKVKDDASKMITNISGTVVGQYINRGRSSVFQSNLTKIVSFQRTEVLDDVTCDMCLSLDEKVIAADDPMAQMDIVHTNCRGLWVPIFETDAEQPEETGLGKAILDSFETVDGRPHVNSFQQLKKPMNPSNKATQALIRRKMGI